MRTASVKGNQARKILSFYRVNFSFSPPYKVLCDGETIALALLHNLYLKQSLPALLGATAHVVVTECILRELRQKGDDYSNAAVFARRVERVPCNHNDKLCGRDCIVARLKKPFSTKVLLASSDPELLASLRDVPGVPLVSISNNSKLVLKPPPAATLDFVQRNELHKTKEISDADKALVNQVRAEKRAARPVRKAVAKKKAKGPNPLSMKKSKSGPVKQEDELNAGVEENGPVANTNQDDGDESNDDGNKRRRKRKRKRTRGSAKSDAAETEPETEEGGTNDVDESADMGTGSTPPAKRARTQQSTPGGNQTQGESQPTTTTTATPSVPVNTKLSLSRPTISSDTRASAVEKKRPKVPSPKEEKGSDRTNVLPPVKEARDGKSASTNSSGPSEEHSAERLEGKEESLSEKLASSNHVSRALEEKSVQEVPTNASTSTVKEATVTSAVHCEKNSMPKDAPVTTEGEKTKENEKDENEGPEPADKPAKKKQRKNRRRRPKKVSVEQKES